MATKINTVGARDALKPRHTPYWHRVRKGAYVGFRKTSATAGGAWLARFRDGDSGKQQVHSLGRIEHLPPNERFDAAVREAEGWFRHRDTGGTAEVLTVGDACREYVLHLLASGRESTSKDADGRFKRWVYSNARFSNTPLLKLTPKIVSDWRVNLAKTMAMPQDKAKDATKPRSASSLNRDMTSLRAALNLARENGHVTTDQAWLAKLRPVENADGRRDVYLDSAQRRKLIDAAPADLATLLQALSLVPLRPGAIAALTVKDFDKRLRVVTIGKDKKGKDRKITLPAQHAAFFESQCKDKLPSAPLFTRADGKAWDKDAWKGPIKDAVHTAKLPLATTAYALRHSAITDLIALHKLDTLTVAQLSGTSLQMIERHYGHLLQDHAANALAKLAL